MKVFLIFISLLIFDFLQGQPNSLSPSLISYIPNTNLSVRDVHTDCEGNIVYVGGTSSSAFSISPNTKSSFYNGGNSDVFIIKIDSSGMPLWSTLLGGNLYDRAYAVEFDSAGFIYVAGRAGTGLPVTTCALQQNFSGDNNPNSAYGIQDGFITKITPDGSTIVWSTYIGCDGRGFVRDIDIDSKGNIWAGISNASPNFPHITENAIQTTTTASMSPALIKISADGTTLLYGTFLSDGVSTSAGPTTVRVDKKDNVYFLCHVSKNKIPVTNGVFQPKVAGKIDFVIAKFDSNGSLLFCSFLGGPGNEEVETHSLEVDTAGNAIVAAYTSASGYPIVGNVVQTTFGGMIDGVLTKISSDGSAILASSYLGGTLIDEIQGIGVDANNNIYVTGRTTSSDFPIKTSTAFQPNFGGANDGHISVLSSDLSTILYATFIGGTGNEDIRTCHVDEFGKVHAGGNTASSNFPIINGFHSTLTGMLTGTALIFNPDMLFLTNTNCKINNEYKDPCLNTSLNEMKEGNKTLVIYPNPVTNNLTITIANDQITEENIHIYNAFGILIEEFKIKHTVTINTTDYQSGLYFIHIVNRSNKSLKFLKL